jgi:hypothetical protein
MITSLTIITCLGLICITCLEIFCPANSQNSTIILIIGFLTPTIGQILNLYKANENGKGIADVKVATNGQTEHAIQTASKIATLTEQVQSAKAAAEVAANTTAATAAALIKKDG